MKKMIQLADFNAIETNRLAIAISETTYCNEVSGKPEKMVVKIATDPNKIPTHALDIPIYLPLEGNYLSATHYEMLDAFKKDPFVAIEFERLALHVSKAGNYYGTAQGFSVVTKAQAHYLLEDVL